MTINSSMKVRDLALEVPQATRVFEKLKIDYCCGGDTPLAEACTSAGVELSNVMRMLHEADRAEMHDSTTPDFPKLSLTELIAYILDKHHVYTKDEITRLEALVSKVLGAHGANHPELNEMAKLFEQICGDLTPHMFKEEQVLFPYLLELESAHTQRKPRPFARFGTVNNPVRMMMLEHDTVGEILRELRTVTSDYSVPADGCISYRTLYSALEAFEKDLHQHIHLENNILFPQAIEMERDSA